MTARRPPTYKPAMDAATQAVIAAARKHGVALPIPSIVTEAAVRAYLDAYRTRDMERLGPSYSPITRQMVAMKVGDVIRLEPIHKSTLFGFWKTARKLMNEPDAKWASREIDGATEVTRLRNDAPYRKLPSSPIVLELMSLQPGESVLSRSLRMLPNSRTTMDTSYRASARRYLNDNQADWTVKTTNQGVRLTRVR